MKTQPFVILRGLFIYGLFIGLTVVGAFYEQLWASNLMLAFTGIFLVGLLFGLFGKSEEQKPKVQEAKLLPRTFVRTGVTILLIIFVLAGWWGCFVAWTLCLFISEAIDQKRQEAATSNASS